MRVAQRFATLFMMRAAFLDGFELRLLSETCHMLGVLRSAHVLFGAFDIYIELVFAVGLRELPPERLHRFRIGRDADRAAAGGMQKLRRPSVREESVR